jgi:hypothetical protein
MECQRAGATGGHSEGHRDYQQVVLKAFVTSRLCAEPIYEEAMCARGDRHEHGHSQAGRTYKQGEPVKCSAAPSLSSRNKQAVDRILLCT